AHIRQTRGPRTDSSRLRLPNPARRAPRLAPRRFRYLYDLRRRWFNNTEQPHGPQFETLPLLVDVGMLIVDLVQAGHRMPNGQLAYQIGHRQRRQAGPNGPSDVVNHEWC